jgi:hypothetical protein
MNDFIDLARKEYGVERFVLQYAPILTFKLKDSMALCSQGTPWHPIAPP